MILPAASMLCQYPCAGPTRARWDSAAGALTGVVVQLADFNAGVTTGVVQGTKPIGLRIVNQSNKQSSAHGGAIKHEHISYP